MYKNTLIAFGIAGILVLSASAVARPASAQTLDGLQTQLQQLLARIADLTNQLNILKAQEGGNTMPTPTQSIGAQHRVCSVLSRNLSQGMSGQDVTALQEFLRDQGHFSADVTGYFGPVTAAAVARWQASQGLEAVGVVGPLTRERIKKWCGGGSGSTGKFSADPERGSAPLTVAFKVNVALTNPAGVADAGEYKITFGDGSEQRLICTSMTTSCPGPHRVEHTYAANGTYTASLVHYGLFGLQESVAGTATIYVGSQACTKEYMPVCGSKQVQCVTTPCNPIQQTYSNRCMLNADGATFLHAGACGNPSNKPPVISSFTGPTVLAVNETGTWRITASDPENQSLSYFVSWGDEYELTNNSAVPAASFVQATTFTHVYAEGGRYTVTVVVRDAAGNEVRTTSTVSVAGSVVCTLEYSPVCGQPPEPACRTTPPYCMLPTPSPQTYANKCLLNAAGARLLYEGECRDEFVACPADAYQCPDGSWVGRTGSNCEFVCPDTSYGGSQCKEWSDGKYCGQKCTRSAPGGAVQCNFLTCMAVGPENPVPSCLEYF